jgi:hypothetical protein
MEHPAIARANLFGYNDTFRNILAAEQEAEDMIVSCIVCDKDIDLDEDDYEPDVSIGTYWCKECAKNEEEM